MTGLAIGAAIIVFIGIMLWRAKKAGKDEVRADVAEEVIDQIIDGSKPVDASERQQLRDKYKRT